MAAAKKKQEPVVDRAAIAKKKAADKVEKAKRPVVLQSGVRLTREEAGRHAALHRPKPSPTVKLP